MRFSLTSWMYLKTAFLLLHGMLFYGVKFRARVLDSGHVPTTSRRVCKHAGVGGKRVGKKLRHVAERRRCGDEGKQMEVECSFFFFFRCWSVGGRGGIVYSSTVS